jgi:microcystin-dependent protein
VTAPFLAEIRIFPFGFAPSGWAQCNGQSVPINQNPALFSLIGTIYGGDGKTNFMLPNLQGASAMFYGQSPGGSLYTIGQTGGVTSVTLFDMNMPGHNHALQADARPATLNYPGPSNALTRSSPNIYKQPTGATTVQMAQGTIGMTGNGVPHNNLMPYLTLNFCIALQGIYPSRP